MSFNLTRLIATSIIYLIFEVVRRLYYHRRIGIVKSAQLASPETIAATRRAADQPIWAKGLQPGSGNGVRLQSQPALERDSTDFVTRSALLLYGSLAAGGLVLLIGCLVALSLIQDWRKRTPLVVILQDHPLIPGQATTCVIRRKDARSGARCSAALVERYRIRLPIGLWPSWSVQVMRHLNLVLDSVPEDQPPGFQTTLTIPADALPSCEGEDVGWQWGIEVVTPVRGRRQSREFFPLCVRPATPPQPSLEEFLHLTGHPDSLRP